LGPKQYAHIRESIALTTPKPAEKKLEVIEWSDLIANRAAPFVGKCTGVAKTTGTYSGYLTLPDVFMLCPNCDGERFFEGKGDALVGTQPHNHWIEYTCYNCRNYSRLYSLRTKVELDGVLVVKVGEWPPYDPPTPPKLLSLIGRDRELFLKGRRAEIRGLGIGAYAYYRRVVENQKNQLIDEIIKVAAKGRATAEVLRQLEAAKTETQFSKAIDSIKHVIPESLNIGDHNPVLVLHKALSIGLHDRSDEYCLQLAGTIRIVLADSQSASPRYYGIMWN
jgi:hypothetical protein